MFTIRIYSEDGAVYKFNAKGQKTETIELSWRNSAVEGLRVVAAHPSTNGFLFGDSQGN